MFNPKLNLKAMQAKVDRLLSGFTKLKTELECQIEVLDNEIKNNDILVEEINARSAEYAVKIDQYESIKKNIENFLGQ